MDGNLNEVCRGVKITCSWTDFSSNHMQQSHPFDIVGFGVATLDVIAEVEQFPASGGKTKILSREFHGGGLTATALVAASKLGASCWYGGAMGENDTSHQVRRILTGYGIALPAVSPYPPTAEPFAATVYLEKNTGERTILWSEFLTPPPILNQEAVETALAAKCLFADQFFAETLNPLYRQARSRKIPIVGDFEFVSSHDEEEALTLIDHLIIPWSFARVRGKTDDPATAVRTLLETQGNTVLVVTDGTNGAWYASQDDQTVRHCKAFDVQVCDTTGCGDVFHGAYAAALVFGKSLDERVRYASAAAALKATKKGGQTGAPTEKELNEFLEECPEGKT